MTRPSDAGTRRHRRRRTVAGLAICGAAVFATAAPAFADPPTNSSFETPDVAEGTLQVIAVGDPAITGWTVVSGNVDVSDNDNWAAPDGDQVLDLSGSSRGVIQQSFPTTAGVGYTISWSYGALIGPACTGGERAGVFSVEGSAVIPMALSGNSETDPNWQVATTTFTGTGSPVLLQFNDSTTGPNPACGLAIDNVAIAEDASVPVVDPEVAGGLLAVTALGAGAWFIMRRRRVSGPLAV